MGEVSGILRRVHFHTEDSDDIEVRATREAFLAALRATGRTTVSVKVTDLQRYDLRSHLGYPFLLLRGKAFHVLGRAQVHDTLLLDVEADSR